MPTLSHACLTDPGRTHPENQDRWYADPDYGLYIVADGMAVEEPAQLVVDLLPDSIRRQFGEASNLAEGASSWKIRYAVAEVSRRIHALALEGPRATWLGLGATLVLALIRWPHALLAHFGDSRIYLLRDGKLEGMTCDHSRVEELVQRGELTREQANGLASNGGPTRFAGMADAVLADTRLVELLTGDRLLLCSDGLTAMLEDSAIQRVLKAYLDPAVACRALIDEANSAGGEDNVTVLIIDVSV
jgi:protein phosphatase